MSAGSGEGAGRGDGPGRGEEPGRGETRADLPPPALRAEAIASAARRLVGRHVRCVAEAGSTNDLAFAALESDADAAHGLVVFAESQTAGRGRRGRAWRARAGRGLLLSVALRAPVPPPAPALVAGAAVALRDAIRATSGLEARIKWPNDLLVSGRKACGILVEARTRGGAAHVVVGIGLDVNDDPSVDFDPDLRATATSLAAAAGRLLDREAVARAALDALDDALTAVLAGDFLRIETEFAEGLGLLGEAVRAAAPAGQIDGELLGFDARRGLALRTATGTEWLAAETVTALAARPS